MLVIPKDHLEFIPFLLALSLLHTFLTKLHTPLPQILNHMFPVFPRNLSTPNHPILLHSLTNDSCHLKFTIRLTAVNNELKYAHINHVITFLT